MAWLALLVVAIWLMGYFTKTILLITLAAILAGYSAHRLFRDPTPDFVRWQAIAAAAALLVAACLAVLLGLWLGRLPRLPLPLSAAAVSFAAARK